MNNLPPGITFRFATVDDADTITHQRRLMFEDMEYTDPARLDVMDKDFIVWLRPKLEHGEYIGWLLMDSETVVAGAGLWLIKDPPRPHSLSGLTGYVMNVFTEAPYRRRGLARCMMESIIEWCRDHELEVIALHASEKGFSLYQSLGFTRTNEMRYKLGD